MKKLLLLSAGILIGANLVAQSPRLSLYEEFTGEDCGPCASTNPGLNAILLSPTNANKIVAIKWQVPIPSAPSATWSLYQTNKAEIDWRYRSPASGGYGYASQSTPTSAVSSQGVNSAPQGRIDGQHQWVFGAQSDHPFYMSNAVITTAQSYTSAFTINMTRAWNYNCSAVDLTVSIVATAPFTAVGNLKFRTVMVERHISFATPPGKNGEKVFEDAAIKSFPSIQNGTPLPGTWTLNQTHTFTMTCPIPSYCRDKSEIAMVGFIQDDGDKKVAQAARADKAALPADQVTAVAGKVEVTCSNQITPQISIFNNGANAITAMTVVPYLDNVAQAPIAWTGNVAANTSADIVLNAISTPTTAGAHTFSYNIVAINAPLFNVTNNTSKVNYVVATSHQGTPVSEGLEATTFPPTGWTSINPNGGVTWTRSINGIGAYGMSSFSMKYDFYTNAAIGDEDEFYLPPINLEGDATPEMTFDLSYAQRITSSDDKLEIKVSSDCGANWTTVYSNSGTGMRTEINTTGNQPFVPNASDLSHWRSELVLLPGFNKPEVLVKFVTTSDNGNNLYLDNINLSQKNPVGIREIANQFSGMSLMPNPAGNSTEIRISSNGATTARLNVTNAIGQVVYEKEVQLQGGANSISVDLSTLANGIYNVSLQSQNGNMVKTLAVSR